MKKYRLNYQSAVYVFLFAIFFIYAIFKAYTGGNDINIYLRASQRLLNNENLYPNYLYSPLFALILSPLSFLNSYSARILWALVNFSVVFRLWQLLNLIIIKKYIPEKRKRLYFLSGLFFISAGFLNHNLILGQITIIILWLTAEGLYQLFNNKDFLGSGLIALGINIKILPLIFLFYLFFKKKYKSTVLIIVFVAVSLFLPALVIGYQYNNLLLHSWMNRINPSTQKYVLEDNNESNSVSAILPAYFYKFNELNDTECCFFKRKVFLLSEKSILFVILLLKLSLGLSILGLIFYKYKFRHNKTLYLFWEFAWLMLISLLIFPHQMAYALLYIIPAEIYILFYFLMTLKQKKKLSLKFLLIFIPATVLMTISALSGRDIIGNKSVNILNFYHFHGLMIFCFLFFLLAVKPDDIINPYKNIRIK